MIRKIIKGPLSRLLQPLARFYLSKDRNYRAHGIEVRVLKGVFHPGLFFSTEILIQYLSNQELADQKFLELGAGTGLISIWARRRGAVVTSSDVSEKAVQNLETNANLNQVELSILHSDLFQSLPPQIFDWILINPPYYPKAAQREEEKAWFCGPNFEFFEELFQGLGSFTNGDSRVIMILSQDCDHEAIIKIGWRFGFEMSIESQKRRWFENNIIYQITPLNGSL